MSKLLKNRFRLETLEDRVTPALTIGFDGSNLAIYGFASSGTLTVTQNATDVTVADGASTQNYAVTGNITISLTNVAQIVDLNIDNPTAGSITVAVGNGGNTIDLGGAGSITGNFTATSGSGVDTFTGVAGVPVAGNTSINLGTGNDTLNLNGVFGGNVQLTNANIVNFGVNSTVGGMFLYSSTEAVINTVTVNATAAISGNAILTGGSLADTFTIDGDVAGSVTAQLGAGANTFNLGGTSAVGGSLTVIGGVAADTVNLNTGSTIGGNLSLIMGNGANTATLSGTVSGTSITYQGGSGVDLLTFAATAAASGARLSAFLGDGADTFTLNSNLLASAYIDFGFGTDTFISTVPINFPFTTRNL